MMQYDVLNTLKTVAPLVVHYTNDVTVNDCANVTLALGASPMMSSCDEEVADAVSVAGAVVINIGTMNSSRLSLYLSAGHAANASGVPVLLDPVGVFATRVRGVFVEQLLREVHFDVIKGNAAEISCLAGAVSSGKGVDSADGDVDDISNSVAFLAERFGCVVGATGAVDAVSDGSCVVLISNGSRKLKKISGTGCMVSSLVGSYLGLGRERIDALDATVLGILSMSVAGELADADDPAIGSYRVQLMNEIYQLTPEKLRDFGRFEKYHISSDV